MIDPGVRISDVVRASSCPLQLYHSRQQGLSESDRFVVCRQLSYPLGKELDASAVWAEICAVRPRINPDCESYLARCIERCQERSWRRPEAMDIRVRSEKLGLFGSIDLLFDSEPEVGVVSARHTPLRGCYRSERLRLTGCILCLEEQGAEAGKGAVYYITDGIERPVILQPRDRRDFLNALRHAREVVAGTIPERPLNSLCSGCMFKDRCTPPPRRLIDLFRKR